MAVTDERERLAPFRASRFHNPDPAENLRQSASEYGMALTHFSECGIEHSEPVRKPGSADSQRSCYHGSKSPVKRREHGESEPRGECPANKLNQTVTTSTPREAEMAKLIENTYRQVNIALVNELAIMARELNVDIWGSLAAAATKPFGYQAFWPGPGVGGHCISIDPSYLSWRAGQQLGYRINFIEHANEVNNRMPTYVVSRLGEALNELGKPIKDTKILAIGITYKAGVNDQRESPALTVLERLHAKGAAITYHDPYAPSITIQGGELHSVPITEETVRAADAVLVLTAHEEVDYRMVIREAALVFDTRGVSVDLDAPNVVRL